MDKRSKTEADSVEACATEAAASYNMYFTWRTATDSNVASCYHSSDVSTADACIENRDDTVGASWQVHEIICEGTDHNLFSHPKYKSNFLRIC